MQRSIVVACLVFLVAAGGANADITVYRGTVDHASSLAAASNWSAALTTSSNVINWDDVPLADGSQTTILGNRYSWMPGSPMLSVDGGSGLWVIDPDSDSVNFFGSDFVPVSGENVFAPDGWPDPSIGPEGTLTIAFDRPAYALGVWFLDVEGDYDSTGIRVGETLYAFDRNQGDNSRSFLGIVSTTPFTAAEILMSADSGGNGVGIDDTMYALVPVPAAVLIGMLGLGAAGLKLRKLV